MANAKTKKGILERLAAGPVIGDGGVVAEMERRGYVMAGAWTPEANIEHPEAVRQIHKEFLRAGADVIQTFTFFACDDKMEEDRIKGKHSSVEINQAACDLAKEAVGDSDALIAGGIAHVPSYTEGKGKLCVQDEFRKQLEVLLKNDVDFLICETIGWIEEMEWAIQTCMETGKTVAATMSIGPSGDSGGVPVGECAVRMAKAGAHIVGTNCRFDPNTALEVIGQMKRALDQEGLKPFLMTQPLGYTIPEQHTYGWLALPEYPFALEPRSLTRWDMQKYAREAYELGVRYIGGCCGFEAYHIRALSEELAAERKITAPASAKHMPWGEANALSFWDIIKTKAGKDYWSNITPYTGRLFSPALAKIDKDSFVVGKAVKE